MTCDKHGWAAGPPCPDCINERRKEAERRERFVWMATIYFYERRRWYGQDEETAAKLRLECWADAAALYDSQYRQPPPDAKEPPVMP